MSLITHTLNQTCGVLSTSTNVYGESVFVSLANLKCRLREITGLDKQSNREQYDCDAILWLEPTASVVEGQIIRVEDRFYRINKIIKARRFSAPVVFIKCLLDVYHDIEGVS
jgi:hypothetical protein